MEPTNEFDPTNQPLPEDHFDEKPSQDLPPVEPEAPAPAPTQETAPVASAPVAEVRQNSVLSGVKDAPLAGVSLSTEALAVKQKLSQEAKLPIYIPLDPGETKGAYRSVTINGYRCEVKKGVMVSVPESIHKLLMNAYQIESEALNDNPRNLAAADEETRRALGV